MQLFVHTKFCSFVVPESHFYPSADGTVAPLRSLIEKHEFVARQVEHLFVFRCKTHPNIDVEFGSFVAFIRYHLETEIYDTRIHTCSLALKHHT